DQDVQAIGRLEHADLRSVLAQLGVALEHAADLALQRVDALLVLARELGARHLRADLLDRALGVARIALARGRRKVAPAAGDDAAAVARALATVQRRLHRIHEVAGDAF